MPKVSVIVPVYNVEKYLSKCLDSILNQTLEDIEIICVNDGSTDGSPEILRQYALRDVRIKIIDKSNGGLSSARNVGMEAAGSEYIGFVDSDDWIEPETYEIALREMLENKDVDLVCWGANVISEEKGMDCADAEKYHKLRIAGKQKLTDEIVFNTTATVCNKLWKRDIISKNGLSFPDGLLFEDSAFFWMYVVDCAYIYYLDGYFYNYLQRKDSIMRFSCAKKYQTPFRLLCWEAIYDYYEKKGILRKKKELLERIFLDMYYSDMSTSPQPEKTNAYAVTIISKYELDVRLDHDHMRYSFIEKLFSIKNSRDGLHKVICIFGIRMKYGK